MWYCPLDPVPIKAIRAFSCLISCSFSGVQEVSQGVVANNAVPPATYPRLLMNCLSPKSTPFLYVLSYHKLYRVACILLNFSEIFFVPVHWQSSRPY